MTKCVFGIASMHYWGQLEYTNRSTRVCVEWEGQGAAKE